MSRIWRILSIDGGGTRGVIPAHILAFIEKQTGKPISQLFDLIAGTSTGGILSLLLTKPDSNGGPQYSAQQLCEIYESAIPYIFRNPQSWLGNLLTPKYTSIAIEKVLRNAFGDCRLKNALTDVLIPCYDINHRLPYMFRSRLARQRADCDFPMKDVALATSATPTLFAPMLIPSNNGDRFVKLVDGGVFANNPAIGAFAELRSLYPGEDDKFVLVSIGCGKSTRPLTEELLSLWGYVHWSRPMIELVLESISESAHEQMKHLLQNTHQPQYFRLQVDIPKHGNHAIDNATRKNLHALRQAALDFCSESQHGPELLRMCETLFRLSQQNEESANAQKAQSLGPAGNGALDPSRDQVFPDHLDGLAGLLEAL